MSSVIAQFIKQPVIGILHQFVEGRKVWLAVYQYTWSLDITTLFIHSVISTKYTTCFVDKVRKHFTDDTPFCH